MKADDCPEIQLLIQADLDGELTPAETARAEAHLQHCPGCAYLQTQLVALGGRIRREVMPFQPPDALLNAVRDRLAALAPQPAVVELVPAVSNDNRVPWWRRMGSAAPFGGGFAVAACLALVLLLPETSGLADAVVSDHIRALQPGHLIDVVSTDQHTVKPWFDGRLDFAPPVKDFKAAGFPLQGGRLDYLDGKQAAALIYQRGRHVIDLFVWPEGSHPGAGATAGSLHGYNYVRWHADGMAFWAVSDLEPDQLGDFVRLMQTN
jgi:anti-sigma factor RsiW